MSSGNQTTSSVFWPTPPDSCFDDLRLATFKQAAEAINTPTRKRDLKACEKQASIETQRLLVRGDENRVFLESRNDHSFSESESSQITAGWGGKRCSTQRE